jgi:hypothetical protein
MVLRNMKFPVLQEQGKNHATTAPTGNDVPIVALDLVLVHLMEHLDYKMKKIL